MIGGSRRLQVGVAPGKGPGSLEAISAPVFLAQEPLMRLNMEPRPVLAICLNPAWQKILTFRLVRHGEVNRAAALRECGGGKGVNVVRALRHLGLPAAAAVFHGGDGGRRLLAELTASGVETLAVATVAQTRTCVTLISQENHEVTELIEPSAPIAPVEVAALRGLLDRELVRFGAVTLSGTVPPGVDGHFYAGVAAQARSLGIPVVLDAVNDIHAALHAGVTVLKINAAELHAIAPSCDLQASAESVLKDFSGVAAVAVTDGAEPAWLITRKKTWRLTIPELPGPLVSAIGGGDCTTAVLARRLAEHHDEELLPDIFREALACASASCLTEIPSVFDPAIAADLNARIAVECVQ